MGELHAEGALVSAFGVDSPVVAGPDEGAGSGWSHNEQQNYASSHSTYNYAGC